MPGINIDIGGSGLVDNCRFDDTSVSGSGGSSLDNDGSVRQSWFNLNTGSTTNTGDWHSSHIDVYDFTVSSSGRVHDCDLSVQDLYVSGEGFVSHCEIAADTVTLSGDGAQLHGGYVGLSPSTGVPGILMSGDSCAVDGIRIDCVSPGAENDSDCVSITGSYGLVDSVRFTQASTSVSWQYLVSFSTASTGSVVGNYTFVPDVAGTGEVST